MNGLTCRQDPIGSPRLACSWFVPADKNGIIRNYQVNMIDNGASNDILFQGEAKATSVTIDKPLNFDHSYTVSVKAVTIKPGPALQAIIRLEAISKDKGPSLLSQAYRKTKLSSLFLKNSRALSLIQLEHRSLKCQRLLQRFRIHQPNTTSS